MRRSVVLAVVVVVTGCAARSERVSPPAEPGPAVRNERASFAEARRLVREGRCAEAVAILAPLADDYPELQDYTLHFLAECRARLGEEDAAAELWERLRVRHPSSVHLTSALLGLARVARRSGDPAEARSLLEGVRRRAVDGEARTASWLLAELDEESGDWRAANRRFMQIRSEVPGTALGRRAKQRVVRLRERFPSLAPHGDELEEELSLLVREGDSDGALRLADRLLASAPADRVPRLLRLRADAERAAGRFDDALATLHAIAADHPQSAVAPEALYRSATWLWNRDRDEEAKRDFAELLRRYPGTREAETLYALGRIEETAGRPTRAIATYARLARSHPGGAQGQEASWRIGWILYREGRWPEAAEQFARAETGDRASALYWRARALDRAGEGGEAVRLYRRIADEEDGYYALWAERRLGVRQAEVAVAVHPVEPRIDIAAAPATDPYHLVRARELQAIVLRDLARREMRAFEKANPRTPELTRYLIATYPAVDGYRDAIRLAYEQGEPDPAVLYPVAFWSLVARYARQRGLDPLRVLALMRQESLFDPAARSPAGARGLMQLLPSTARQVARRLGRAKGGDLYDPEVNIDLGTAHLDQLLRDHAGDWIETLAAYNGGEAALAKWEERFGNLPPDEFVESITYRETKDYVKRVLGHYRRYRAIYGAPSGGADV